MIKVPATTAWRVRAGRIISTTMIVVAIVLGGFTWHLGLYGFAAFNAFLLGVNVVVAWINWFVFET